MHKKHENITINKNILKREVYSLFFFYLFHQNNYTMVNISGICLKIIMLLYKIYNIKIAKKKEHIEINFFFTMMSRVFFY